MNKSSSDFDVSALLRALRSKAEEMGRDVQVEHSERSLIRQMSDRVAALPELTRARPQPDSVVRSVREVAEDLRPQVRIRDVGTVLNIGDGVATLSGLPRARTNGLVTFPTGVQGMILNLERDHVDVILLGAEEGIQGGDLVTATGARLKVPVGNSLLGRVVNPLGVPLDDGEAVDVTEHRFLERDAPSIVERVPVSEPLQTGLKVIDALVPVGRGQRELIVGDRQTGKTTIAVDTILNQGQESEVVCIYVAIGQKKSSTLAMIETLRKRGAMPYTTVVMASPDDPPALRYLAPYAGCTLAEFFMDQGRDVLIIYDDLSKHADAYRELSLLLRRPPGREAYPGDIFYLHSRLLERAARVDEAHGGGSMTALPIVETQRGNISAYIPTNLISITDGQIVLETELFNRGIKPAVNAGRSVSRVGGKAQTPVMRELAGPLRLELSQYEEVARFARIGTDVDEATQQQIRRGERLQRILTQSAHRPLSLAQQVMVLLAATEGYLDAIPLDRLREFEREALQAVERRESALVAQLNRSGELTDEMRAAFLRVLASYVNSVWREEGGTRT